MSEVRIRAAIVMPDTGFDEEPIRPTMRLETVTKNRLKTTMRKAPSRLTGTPGKSQMATAMRPARAKTIPMGRSCCVRGRAGPPPPRPMDPIPSLKLSTMVGRLLTNVMIPAKPTAPAPT